MRADKWKPLATRHDGKVQPMGRRPTSRSVIRPLHGIHSIPRCTPPRRRTQGQIRTSDTIQTREQNAQPQRQ